MEIKIDTHHKYQDVYVITLNRTKALNAINYSMIEKLGDILSEIENQSDVRGLIFKSSHKNSFCSGIDVNYIRNAELDDIVSFFVNLQRIFNRISNLPFITIAIIQGYAFGAGADLAIACDIRLADCTAKFRFPGPQFGLILGTHRLRNEIGASNTRFLTLTNKVIAAKQALDNGIIHEKLRGEELCGYTDELLDRSKTLTLNTIKNIRNIMSNIVEDKSECYVENSIRDGDFKRGFSQYLESI